MGFMTSIKANKAYRLQQKGQKEEALRLYQGRAMYAGNLATDELLPMVKKYGLVI